jgi:general secretion pathway protein I
MVSRARSGFSLMEMLVVTAVLLVAVGVLAELAGVGRQHARAAEDAATAQRTCQNLVQEILCGALPLEAVSEAVVPETPEWTYSIALRPLEQFEWDPGLAELRVTVAKTPDGSKPGKPFSLTRWVRYSSRGKRTGERVDSAAPSAPPRPLSEGLPP